MVSRRAALAGALLLVLLTAAITWGLAGASAPGAGGVLRRAAGRAGFATLAAGLLLIQTRYAGRTDAGALAQAALRGAAASLGDPYSTYLSPAAYQAVLRGAAGRYDGIGIEVLQDAAGYPIVDRVLPGTPAATTPYSGSPPGAAPGLRPGDRILSVDGRSAAGLDPAVLQTWIAGAQGTQVALQVLRPPPDAPGASGSPAAEPLRFAFTRRPIRPQSVSWQVLPGGVGDIDIAVFNARTPGQMQAAVAALRARRVRAVVVDLRDDPGGLVSAAQQVARHLLPGGVLAYLQPRTGVRLALPVPSPEPLGVPYAVLVDGYTASAAEMLAGAVQDDGAAPLVGERTFGKGSVQELFPLAGGGALKLTVAHYLTPAGRDLDGAGLAPDVAVPFPDDSPQLAGNLETDPQLAAAVALLRSELAAA